MSGTALAPSAQPRDPFMVAGRVNGFEERASVPTPAAALSRMRMWLRADGDATPVWYLREDWPEAVTLVGRTAPGLVGESRRSAHLFQVLPGAALQDVITARCGAEHALHEIEWLRLGAGMPCEHCLVRAASRRRPRQLGGIRG